MQTALKAQPRTDALRFRKVRRIRLRERASLGLQAGVGYDDHDLDRARFYRALEQAIEREVRQASLKPLAAVGFDGKPGVELVTTLENPDNDNLTDAQRDELKGGYIGVRNVNSCPLDYMHFQSRAPLELFEWLAGKRFSHDWHIAQGGSGLAQSLDELMNAKVAKPTREERKRERLRPTTFRPRKAKRVKAGPSSGGDGRLDAMARLGRLCDEVSPISWWLLVEMVGNERWAKDVAAQLRVSPEYAGQRFREALIEAASHYARRPSRKPRSRS